MGSGASKSKTASLPSRPIVNEEAASQSGDPRHNDNNLNELGSSTEMQIAKSPTCMEDIKQHQSIRNRFCDYPDIKKIVVPRLTKLVRESKISCLRSLTIKNKYGKQLQEIVNIIKYETDAKGYPLDEKKERTTVLSSHLADFVNKLGLVWTLAKSLKTLKKNRSCTLAETETDVRKGAAMLSVFNANICNEYRKSGILDMVVEDLQDPVILNCTEPEKSSERSIMITSIIIVDHCAMHGAIDLVLKSKLCTIIHPYSRSAEKAIQIHAIVCLCQLQSEDDKDMFLQDEYLVLTLTDAIQHALNSPDHCYAEVQLSFLLKGLAQLASKDTNHSMLLSNGVINLLKSVVKVGDVNESYICMNALWLLSFDPTATQLMREDSELMDILDTQSKCDTQNTRNAADAVKKQVEEINALQVLEGNDESNEQTTDKKDLIKTEQETPKKRKHVMISYQWDTQEILLRVRDKLKECGYELWMDVDNIGGSTLQAMAEAVEESAVVLVCYSHRYKSSPNARTEAEYAFQLRRDIIPLKMEKGYQADGWLGAIIGTKLYIEVDPEGNGFDTSMNALIKELGDRGKSPDVDTTGAVVPKTEIVTRTVNAVTKWTRYDVIQWAKQNGIKSRKVANMTGEDLLFLQNLRKEAPQYFFGILEKKLGIRSLEQIRIMSTALKDL